MVHLLPDRLDRVERRHHQRKGRHQHQRRGAPPDAEPATPRRPRRARKHARLAPTASARSSASHGARPHGSRTIATGKPQPRTPPRSLGGELPAEQDDRPQILRGDREAKLRCQPRAPSAQPRARYRQARQSPNSAATAQAARPAAGRANESLPRCSGQSASSTEHASPARSSARRPDPPPTSRRSARQAATRPLGACVDRRRSSRRPTPRRRPSPRTRPRTKATPPAGPAGDETRSSPRSAPPPRRRIPPSEAGGRPTHATPPRDRRETAAHAGRRPPRAPTDRPYSRTATQPPQRSRPAARARRGHGRWISSTVWRSTLDVRQRTRDQRQSPATEKHRQIQAVEDLQQVHVLGVAATPRGPQIAQSPQAQRLVHTPRARVRSHVLTPGGEKARQPRTATAVQPSRRRDTRTGVARRCGPARSPRQRRAVFELQASALSDRLPSGLGS